MFGEFGPVLAVYVFVRFPLASQERVLFTNNFPSEKRGRLRLPFGVQIANCEPATKSTRFVIDVINHDLNKYFTFTGGSILSKTYRRDCSSIRISNSGLLITNNMLFNRAINAINDVLFIFFNISNLSIVFCSYPMFRIRLSLPTY